MGVQRGRFWWKKILLFCCQVVSRTFTSRDYRSKRYQLTGFYNLDGMCLLRDTDWVFVGYLDNLQAGKPFSHRPLITEALVRSQVTPCGICGGQVALGQNFSSTSVFPCQYHATSDPQKKKNYVALVRERTIPTERPPPVGEVSANFCG